MTTASRKHELPHDARSIAELYLSRGLAPIPVPAGKKGAIIAGWQDLRLTPDNLDEHFAKGKNLNVAVLNGTPSGNSVDIDLDAVEASRAAQVLLPRTGWIFGRRTSPASHWIYRAEQSLNKASDKYTDLDGSVLVELRGTGGYTIFPGSIHEGTGEHIQWEQFAEPGPVKLSDLRQAVGEVAAVALLARHWPAKGARQDAFLAMAGGLLRSGVEPKHAERIIEALAAATQDDEPTKRVGTVAATAATLKQTESCTSWPRLAELIGDEVVVSRVREWLRLSASGSTVNVPEERLWPIPPAEEAFYGLAGKIVRLIDPASEASLAALLFQLLIGFGNLIGRGAHFRVEGDRHSGNEFVVLVGRTSKARKGTSWSRINQMLKECDELWATGCVKSGASSGEGIIWAVRDPTQKRERIKENGQVRYEDVEADAGVEDKRLLIYEPEFATVLKQIERQGNTLSTILRQAWDGIELRSLTKNSPTSATEAHISVIGHITIEELQRCLSATETANGFANRFLFVCTERSKLLPEGGTIDPDQLQTLTSEFLDAVEFAKSVGEVRRDEAARVLWRQIYGELSEGKPGLSGALLARAEAHVMRLATLYALLDKSDKIRTQHLLAAMALWDYCERSVQFIFGDSLGDSVADELLRLLRGSPNGLTRTEIRDHFQRHESAARIGKALGLLLQHKLARRENEQTAGRPTERWFAAKT